MFKKLKFIIIILMIFFWVISPNIAHAGLFGYLSEFWDKITGRTINAWEYTKEWFQEIGNAVAGALGNVLLMPFKIIFDAIWTLKILFDMFYNILEIGFSILTSFFSFIGSFINDFFAGVIIIRGGEGDLLFSPQAINTFKSIPLVNLLLQVIGYALIALMGFSALKMLKNF